MSEPVRNTGMKPKSSRNFRMTSFSSSPVPNDVRSHAFYDNCMSEPKNDIHEARKRRQSIGLLQNDIQAEQGEAKSIPVYNLQPAKKVSVKNTYFVEETYTPTSYAIHKWSGEYLNISQGLKLPENNFPEQNTTLSHKTTIFVNGNTWATKNNNVCMFEQQPNIQDEAQPNIQDEAQPNIQDEAQPNIQDEAQPNIQDEAQPNIQDEAQPNIQDEAQPNIQDEAQPNIQNEAHNERQKLSLLHISESGHVKKTIDNFNTISTTLLPNEAILLQLPADQKVELEEEKFTSVYGKIRTSLGQENPENNFPGQNTDQSFKTVISVSGNTKFTKEVQKSVSETSDEVSSDDRYMSDIEYLPGLSFYRGANGCLYFRKRPSLDLESYNIESSDPIDAIGEIDQRGNRKYNALNIAEQTEMPFYDEVATISRYPKHFDYQTESTDFQMKVQPQYRSYNTYENVTFHEYPKRYKWCCENSRPEASNFLAQSSSTSTVNAMSGMKITSRLVTTEVHYAEQVEEPTYANCNDFKVNTKERFCNSALYPTSTYPLPLPPLPPNNRKNKFESNGRSGSEPNIVNAIETRNSKGRFTSLLQKSRPFSKCKIQDEIKNIDKTEFARSNNENMVKKLEELQTYIEKQEAVEKWVTDHQLLFSPPAHTGGKPSTP